MGFKIIDSNGNLKLSSFGTGASLPDPVTVIHGGTGLTTTTQGDLLYASADNTIAKLAKDVSGTRILTNQGSSNNPTWSDPSTVMSGVPVPTTKKFALLEADGTTTARVFVWAVALGASTAVTDSTSQWLRWSTTGGAGNQNGFRSNADWAWLDHLPKVNFHIRTGSVITLLRLQLAITNVGAGFITNADDQHLLKGVGIRYSTPAGDTGFTAWTADGTTQTVDTSPIAAIAASTVYSISIEATSTSNVNFTVNGVTRSLSLPAAALGTAMRINAQVTNTTGVAKDLDIAAMYGEWL